MTGKLAKVNLPEIEHLVVDSFQLVFRETLIKV